MNLHDIRLLYLRELRSALRERGIVINSLLIPLFLYPTLMWLMMSGLSFVQGQQERFVPRVALVGLPAAHEELREQLEGYSEIELVEAPAARDEAVVEGEVDAVAEILPPAAEDAGLADNFRLRLTFDDSRSRGARAHERMMLALTIYREQWLERAGQELGLDGAEWFRFRVEPHNVATGGETGAYFLGLMVPILMIVMIAMGSFHPAVDATAGERERSTWETLMTVSASRSSVVAAKYLYVATLGGVAGLLNLLAMALTMRAIMGPVLERTGAALDFQIPLAALPLMALAALLLAMFIAAGMMVFAAFARTFKEGQSMIGPFYLLCILPALAVLSPDLELTPKMALVPIANVALIFREAIAGIYRWPEIAIALTVQAAVVAACLAAARWVLGFEDVLIGSHGGSLGKFLKNYLKRRLSGRGRAEVAS